ncbi:colanic acid biosynthesis acetyltransferase WcaF [Ilyomonas limi]|uniref:Colanic acid biosynthesis acetyltransferase WcaF n=1 Tax=Ilyomonas limi TaxID=2575867 RepID=A0A4U3KZU9_9BACT|nr:putative colanic acid biosynthesis acetyltransferase [Ilyomonas limi]TKK68205.1 colanic acid biosynthesis acetyltransferase WcaF [Ilyomonas limi]
MEVQQLNKFKMPDRFRGKPGWYTQLWWIVEALLFHTSPQFMYGWRRFLLRSFGAKVGKRVIIRSSVRTQFPWKVTIGDYSWIGDDVVLYSLGEIIIGNHVVISQKSYLCTGSHDYTHAAFPIYNVPVVIEDQCWLATDVYIAPGVTIGRGTVIGARSSVFKSLPAGVVCMGSPAKVVKARNVENVKFTGYNSQVHKVHLSDSKLEV